MSEPKRKLEGEAPRVFGTTHWSVVLAAGQGASAPAQDALETLCRAYWYPIYIYVRRKGHGPDEAEDLTQEFFAQLIAKEHLRLADRNKGKFRTFLLATLDYFLAREWSRAHRQKRGGQFTFISLDQQTPDERYRLKPVDNDTPEKVFLRQWALTVLKQAMDALERECVAEGKGPMFLKKWASIYDLDETVRIRLPSNQTIRIRAKSKQFVSESNAVYPSLSISGNDVNDVFMEFYLDECVIIWRNGQRQYEFLPYLGIVD